MPRRSYITNNVTLNYLCFAPTSEFGNGECTVSLSLIPSCIGNVYYSSDGEHWNTYVSDTSIQLYQGEVVYFYGENNRMAESTTSYSVFSINGSAYVHGDVTTLLTKDGNVEDLSGRDYCFCRLFQKCSIHSAPELPSRILSNNCYQYMFYNTAITTAPELPSTVLGINCYSYMFANTSITIPPELPATVLTHSCYQHMFDGCRLLSFAPELPANRLAVNCYVSMFQNCSRLNYIKVGATSWNTSYAANWVNGVAESGTFIKPPDTEIQIGVNGIPLGWVGIEKTFVDLGLPSCILFADSNLGATYPYESGNYYPYGETIEWYESMTDTQFVMKSKYTGGFTSSNYASLSNIKNQNIDLTNNNLQYDVANVKSNGRYHIPSIEEFNELWLYCYFELTDSYKGSGVTGYVIYRRKHDDTSTIWNQKTSGVNYSLDDTHIFLPYTGFGYGNRITYGNGSSTYIGKTNCYYWTNKSYSGTESWRFAINSSSANILNTYKYYAMPIRCVQNKPTEYIYNLLKPAHTDNYDLNYVNTDSSKPIENNPYGRSHPNIDLKAPGVSAWSRSDKVECYYLAKYKVPFIKGHKYYLRWTMISATSNYSSISYDCYCPLKEPSFAKSAQSTYSVDSLGRTGRTSSTEGFKGLSNNTYQMNCCIKEWTEDTGIYPIRFDVDNRNYIFNFNFCCPMLIDLTSAFGDNIPDFQTLNGKPYFDDFVNKTDW